MLDKSLLKIHANHYYNLGLNVTCISNEQNENNFLDNNLYKAPCHKWKHLQEDRQEFSELENFNWDRTIGIGVVLGHENLMALDIDGVVDFDLIYFICHILEIDASYQWIIKSGSGCGFHFLFVCEDICVDKNEIKKQFETERWELVEDFGYPEVNAYYPKRALVFREYGGNWDNDASIYNKYFKENYLINLFQKIEFRWAGHLVLPKSLHQSGRYYAFVNGIPKTVPQKISFKLLKKLKESICFNKAASSSYDAKRDLHAAGDDEILKGSNLKEYKYLIFDTETNGLPIDFKKDFNTLDNWPRLLQLSWVIIDEYSNIIKKESYLIKAINFEIISNSFLLHGIEKHTTELIGADLIFVLEKFLNDLNNCEQIVCHNYEFDSNVLQAEMLRTGVNFRLFQNKPFVCTMTSSTEFCKLGTSGNYKFPSLNELYFKLFGKELFSIHNAGFDTIVTKFCFTKLQQLGVL